MKPIVKDLLFSLIRYVIRGEQIKDGDKSLYTDDIVTDLISLSKKHDISHLVAFGLKQNNLLKNSDEIDSDIFKAVYRYKQLDHNFYTASQILETEKIPFVPLKGILIRKYYPQEWMRTSCDVDILVNESDLALAESALLKYGFAHYFKGSHDIAFLAPNNKLHLELHYTLIEDGVANKSATVLSKVWEYVYKNCSSAYRFEMTDEMFYFYHIAHMAKHFEIGGCGIRPFIDLWMLDNADTANLEKRNELLNEGGLLKFANAVRKLSRVWLCTEEHDELTLMLENYILGGGVYGNSKNRISVQQNKQGGRLKYNLRKIFLPYEELKFQYPVLHKHRWLTPFMEIRRWCRLVFGGKLKRSVGELKYSAKINSNDAKNMKDFLENLGIIE